MMLNQEVCEKCYESNGMLNVYTIAELWKRGYVYCPHELLGSIERHINEEPPLCCPYITEHVVSRGIEE